MPEFCGTEYERTVYKNHEHVTLAYICRLPPHDESVSHSCPAERAGK